MKNKYVQTYDELNDIKVKQEEMSEILDKLHLAMCGSDKLGIPGIVQDVKDIKNKIDILEESLITMENHNYDIRIRRLERFKNASVKTYGIIATFTAVLMYILNKIFNKGT